MYDAIVLGARCAGASTALLLARRGYRVLMVDRATFPSDTISSHLMQLPGAARLRCWGLLDRVLASGCPPIRSMRMEVGDVVLTGSPPTLEGAREMLCCRRTVLDKSLASAAVDAGVELRERYSVAELVLEEGRVVGVRGHGPDAPLAVEKGRIVIGADGRHSLVARSVSAREYEVRPPLTCSYYSYWSGVPADSAELYTMERRGCTLMPTNDGLTVVVVQAPSAEFGAIRADIDSRFMDALDRVPALGERVRCGRREERYRGTADLPNYFRHPYGPGWALVGDAGYNRDPITATGISDAFRDAELLAAAIDDGLSGARPLDAGLAEYHRLRDADALPQYRLTCQMAMFDSMPPDMVQLLRVLSDEPREADRFFGLFCGQHVDRRVLRAGESRCDSEADGVTDAGKWYRRAPYLLLEWEGEEAMVVNCDTLARCRVDQDQIAVLARLEQWRTLDELALAGDPSLSSPVGLDALVTAGVVESRVGTDLDSHVRPVFWNPFDLAVHRHSDVGTSNIARRPGSEGVRRVGSVVALPPPARALPGSTVAVLAKRRSIRRYGDRSLTLDELSTLLHHSAGVVRSVEHATLGELSYRPYPAVGARSPLELYVVASDVGGLSDGAHHYDPRIHRLTAVRERDQNHERLLRAVAAATGGMLNRDPPVVLLVTAVFERTMASHPGLGLGLIYKETGCLYQTLYLVATAMGLAPCAIGGGPERANSLWLGLDPLIESQVGCFLIGPREAESE